jgi:hypothetical protein
MQHRVEKDDIGRYSRHDQTFRPACPLLRFAALVGHMQSLLRFGNCQQDSKACVFAVDVRHMRMHMHAVCESMLRKG